MHGKSPEQAYKDFMAAAAVEENDGCETLSLFRDVRIFSTAPPDETHSWSVIMHYASRHGDRDFVRTIGNDLYNWARNNGYGTALKLLC